MHHDHKHHAAGLTHNQSLVFATLAKAKGPLSAYDLLDQLRAAGLKAPLQVYRALDKLVEQGLAHRLESISAFVACRHPDGENHAAVVFMICEKCGEVAERSNACIAGDLQKLASTDGFFVDRTNIELRGTCGKC